MAHVMAAVRDQLLEEGFVPKEARTDRKERSLFSAVRSAHRMNADDADVLYWNWRELRPHLVNVWRALDAEATARHGSPISAHVWTFAASRTLDEVVDLVSAADARYEGGPLLVGQRRQCVGRNDKARGAICSVVIVLKLGLGITTGELFEQLVPRVPDDSNDEQVLALLDDLAAQFVDLVPSAGDAELAKLLNRYYSARDSRDLSATIDEQGQRWDFADFMRLVIQETPPNISDDELRIWLNDRVRRLGGEPAGD